MRDQAAQDRDWSSSVIARLHTACKRNSTHSHSTHGRSTTCAMAKKANAQQNATAPAELRKLAVQAVKHKATIDDANFKKRELRETLVRLQEALEERRAEERRIAEEARRREEEEAARLAAEEERLRAEAEAEAARLAAEAEAEESEESEEEEDEEPEPEPEEQAPEAEEEEESSEEEEEDADELMPEPTLRGRVARGMVPFMARASARPMPPAPRRKARPSISFDPPVVAVTPESESESEEEEEPVKVECDEASAEEIESEDEEVPTRRPLCVFTPSTRRSCPRRSPRTKSKRRTRSWR